MTWLLFNYPPSICRYNFGWSHGKEKLESGKPGKLFCLDFETLRTIACMLLLLFFSLCFDFADMLKGSFYANPILDRPTTDEALIQR